MGASTGTTSRLRPDVIMHVGTPGPARSAETAVLLNSVLGEGFVDAAAISGIAENRNSTLARAVNRQGKLVGAATATVLGRRAVLAMQANLRIAGIKVDLTGSRVGELTSSAVTPAARGRGVGSELVRVRMGFLKSSGCRYVICASWVSGDGLQTSAGLLRHAGFEHLGMVPSYWAAEQKSGGYLCAACGTDCVCAAKVMLCVIGNPA